MKKGTLIFLLITLVSCKFVLAQDHFDFRKTTWGMTRDQVKASETMKPGVDTTSTILYTTDLEGMECALGYNFIDGKLTSAGYLFLNSHSNVADFFSDFDRVRDLLIEKYGRPIKDETIWKNNLFRNKPDDLSLALQSGHVVRNATWSTQSTNIVLRLFGDNSKITFAIRYSGKQFEQLEKNASDKKAKDKL